MPRLHRLFHVLLLIALVATPCARAESLSAEEHDERLAHAHELLGKYYKRSVVKSGEDVDRINGMIYHWTFQALPKKYRKQYKRIAQRIIDESHRHEFDPVFVLSVIQKESSFSPTRKGSVGELGLMQIRPQTARWVAKRLHEKWGGKKSLYDPQVNIHLGTAYLAYLRERLDSHARLYLAAYNMGVTNVKEALAQKIWPKDYPSGVMEHYVAYYDQLKEKTEKDERKQEEREAAKERKLALTSTDDDD